MTIMNIMVDKAYLAREKSGPVFLYRPLITRKATSRRMLRDLMRRVFDGFQVYRCLTLAPEGVEVGIDLAGPDPVDLEVVDETPGLPSSGAALASARPAS